MQRALRDWHCFMLRRTRRALLSLQDGALQSLLRVWSSSARAAVHALNAWPPVEEAEATRLLCLLGGTWRGGTQALEVAVREATTYKAKLDTARVAGQVRKSEQNVGLVAQHQREIQELTMQHKQELYAARIGAVNGSALVEALEKVEDLTAQVAEFKERLRETTGRLEALQRDLAHREEDKLSELARMRRGSTALQAECDAYKVQIGSLQTRVDNAERAMLAAGSQGPASCAMPSMSE